MAGLRVDWGLPPHARCRAATHHALASVEMWNNVAGGVGSVRLPVPRGGCLLGAASVLGARMEAVLGQGREAEAGWRLCFLPTAYPPCLCEALLTWRNQYS
jgi:hypothetical protein